MGNISINAVYAPSEKTGEAKWEAARDTIRKVVGRISPNDLDYSDISYSDFLALIAKKVPEDQRDQVVVRLEPDGDCGDSECYLEFEHVREETDEEMTVRLQAQATRRQEYEIEQVRKEMAALAALKAKYEK